MKKRDKEESFIYDPAPAERRERWQTIGALICLLLTDMMVGIGTFRLMQLFQPLEWYLRIPSQIIIAANVIAAHFLVFRMIERR